MSNAPDNVLSVSDPGDEMQRRLRYQAVQLARMVLGLFDETEDIEEVLCEQHEDGLVKYRTGKFRGVQIKTKNDGSAPFKAGDAEIVGAIQKFIREEEEFPDCFSGFLLSTNCGFYRDKKNGSNLEHLLSEAKGKRLSEVSSHVLGYLKKLCPGAKSSANLRVPVVGNQPTTIAQDSALPVAPAQKSKEAELERALSVLQKLMLEATSSLSSMEQLLIQAVSLCPIVGQQQTYADLTKIAEALIAEVLKASSRQHGSTKQAYFAICNDPQRAMADSIIDAKRFTRTRAEQTLRSAFTRHTGQATSTPFRVDSLPVGTRNQNAKMTGGGVLIDDVGEAVQQRLAAEHLVTKWLNKVGFEKANGRYQDLRSMVLTECNQARIEATQVGPQYGPVMLEKVKQRLKAIHESQAKSLEDVRYDHLLGIAGLLTEECPVWWSEKFDLSPGGET